MWKLWAICSSLLNVLLARLYRLVTVVWDFRELFGDLTISDLLFMLKLGLSKHFMHHGITRWKVSILAQVFPVHTFSHRFTYPKLAHASGAFDQGALHWWSNFYRLTADLMIECNGSWSNAYRSQLFRNRLLSAVDKLWFHLSTDVLPCFSNGQCGCLSNVFGSRCDRCRSGYYWNPVGLGCISCTCNLQGSVNQACNATGYCNCKPGNGVGGLKCDQCLPGYYSFISGR